MRRLALLVLVVGATLQKAESPPGERRAFE
jgi:hypothetical protein